MLFFFDYVIVELKIDGFFIGLSLTI